jgi:hypothetical protein
VWFSNKPLLLLLLRLALSQGTVALPIKLPTLQTCYNSVGSSIDEAFPEITGRIPTLADELQQLLDGNCGYVAVYHKRVALEVHSRSGPNPWVVAKYGIDRIFCGTAAPDIAGRVQDRFEPFQRVSCNVIFDGRSKYVVRQFFCTAYIRDSG